MKREDTFHVSLNFNVNEGRGLLDVLPDVARQQAEINFPFQIDTKARQLLRNITPRTVERLLASSQGLDLLLSEAAFDDAIRGLCALRDGGSMYCFIETPSKMRPMQSKTLSDWSSLRIFSSLSSRTLVPSSRVEGATRLRIITGSCFADTDECGPCAVRAVPGSRNVVIDHDPTELQS
jgi:hypothetical protein